MLTPRLSGPLITTIAIAGCSTISGGHPILGTDYDVTADVYKPRPLPATVINVSNTEDDLKPARQSPPRVRDFDQCIVGVRARAEQLTLRFDVTPDGEVVNIAAIDVADDCFKAAAMRAAGTWEYGPIERKGKPAALSGVETVITFTIDGG